MIPYEKERGKKALMKRQVLFINVQGIQTIYIKDSRMLYGVLFLSILEVRNIFGMSRLLAKVGHSKLNLATPEYFYHIIY